MKEKEGKITSVKKFIHAFIRNEQKFTLKRKHFNILKEKNKTLI